MSNAPTWTIFGNPTGLKRGDNLLHPFKQATLEPAFLRADGENPPDRAGVRDTNTHLAF